MTAHDPLCHWAIVFGDQPDESCDCPLIANVRADERGRLERLSRDGVATRDEDGRVTLTIDEPKDGGPQWVPCSVDLLRQWADDVNQWVDLRKQVQAFRDEANSSPNVPGEPTTVAWIEGHVHAFDAVLALLDGQ